MWTKLIDHLVSIYLILTPIEYKEIHDEIENYIRLKVCKYNEILNCEKW